LWDRLCAHVVPGLTRDPVELSVIPQKKLIDPKYLKELMKVLPGSRLGGRDDVLYKYVILGNQSVNLWNQTSLYFSIRLFFFLRFPFCLSEMFGNYRIILRQAARHFKNAYRFIALAKFEQDAAFGIKIIITIGLT